MCFALPGADAFFAPFQSIAVWKGVGRGPLQGGLEGPCPTEHIGIPIFALLFSKSKDSEDFWALWDFLTSYLCGVVGQGYSIVASECDVVIDTGRKGEKEFVLLPEPFVREVGSGPVPFPGTHAGSCNLYLLLLSLPAVAPK